MKITGNEKAIAEIIRANDDMPITIYEVEDYAKVGTGEYGECIIDSDSEWFTTLKEAEKCFDESNEYAEFDKDSGCDLRKITIRMLRERPFDYAIEIDDTIKQIHG